MNGIFVENIEDMPTRLCNIVDENGSIIGNVACGENGIEGNNEKVYEMHDESGNTQYVAADSLLVIEPNEADINLTQGEVYRGTFSVVNNMYSLVTFRISVNPYTTANSPNIAIDTTVKTSESAIVDYTSVLNASDGTATIGARETKEFSYIIDVPKDNLEDEQKEAIIIKLDDYPEFNTSLVINAKIDAPFSANIFLIAGIFGVIFITILVFVSITRHRRGNK